MSAKFARRPFALRNGWVLLRHPAFRDPFDALTDEVTRLKVEAPDAWTSHPKAKLLERIRQLIEEEIPRNPDAPEYRLGNTLGKGRRHWRRAKFLGRFRLFFRFDTKSRIIVYAWVNDENTLRKAGAESDPYAVFGKRLRKGDPPDDWPSLVASTPDDTAPVRLREVVGKSR